VQIDRDRIRELRLRQVLTQVELADRAGLTESTINRLERGLQKAHIGTVRKLAGALGVEPAEIIVFEDERESTVSD
jgi:transcriptional regulator with XRE-family HTH domain